MQPHSADPLSEGRGAVQNVEVGYLLHGCEITFGALLLHEALSQREIAERNHSFLDGTNGTRNNIG
jgi:hypothetical protein